MLWVCPPRLYFRTCQYPTQEGKFLKSIETVAQRCSVKEVFLKFSQNPQENSCANVPILIKLQAWGPEACNFIKKETLAQVFFCEICFPFLTESLRWLLLRAANFVSMPCLCTIRNTSNSLAKAHLYRAPLQNSSQCLLSNVSYFFKKEKNRNNFSYLLWP